MFARDTPRSEDGFTLVELLVATTMALVVFAVTLSTLAVFNDTTQTLTHQNDSQNQARLGIEQIVSQLRNVVGSTAVPSFVERATPYDLVFQTVSVSGGQSQLVRYCVPPDPSPGSLVTEELIAQHTAPSTSIPPTTACPDPAYGPSSVLVGHVTNRYQGRARQVFTYNGSATPPSDLTTIKSIGIDLFVDTTPSASYNESELQSSALLRNAEQPPVAAFTWSSGQSGITLDAGSSYSPSNDPLTYAWSCKTSAGVVVSCPSTGSTFAWSPAAGTYKVTLTVTDQEGLQNTTSPPTTVVVP
jgi:type II secretory pathway pseudopilin PulG